MRLHGRETECQVLDRLVADTLAGKSGVVVLRGEAGIGKSALLAYVSDLAQGTRVARAVGVESEVELAYSSVGPCSIASIGCLSPNAARWRLSSV
jgi:predicted ATP-dependent serine protease